MGHYLKLLGLFHELFLAPLREILVIEVLLIPLSFAIPVSKLDARVFQLLAHPFDNSKTGGHERRFSFGILTTLGHLLMLLIRHSHGVLNRISIYLLLHLLEIILKP